MKTRHLILGIALCLPSVLIPASAQTGAGTTPSKQVSKKAGNAIPAGAQSGAPGYRAAFARCKALADVKKNADAQKACAQAVALSDKLPESNWRERSASRTLLGDLFFAMNNTDDAHENYMQALAIDQKQMKVGDPDLATDYANAAQTSFLLNNLDVADMYFSQASDTFEIAILNDPSKKEIYTHRLKDVLLKYSKVKLALGQKDFATALTEQANALQ